MPVTRFFHRHRRPAELQGSTADAANNAASLADMSIVPSIRSASHQRDVSWLLLIWAIVTAYNLFKPYHIDDAAHLEIARWISKHPLHPMGGILNWRGVNEPIYKTNQPHLYFYLIALWGFLFGYSESAMHALAALPALACVFLFYRLATSYSHQHALWATTLLALGPAFAVEQNLMVDVPLLSMWLAFFTIIIEGIGSRRQNGRYALAGFVCGVALLIKYSSLVLFVVMVASMLLERRVRQVWTLMIPAIIICVWSLFNLADYGAIHIVGRVQAGGEHGIVWLLKEIMAWVIALGALTPLGPIAVVERWAGSMRSRKVIYIVIASWFTLLMTAVSFKLVSDWESDRLLWAVFVVSGLCVCLALTSIARKRFDSISWQAEQREETFRIAYLLLWIGGTSAFYVALAPFIAARHVLLILTPLVLVLISHWGRSLSPESKYAALAFTTVLSAGLGVSDWRFADFYRQETNKLHQMLLTDGTVWSSGHWGFQWYSALNGFKQVDVQLSKLIAGDYLLVANEVDHQLLPDPPLLQLIAVDNQALPLLNVLCTGRIDRLYQSTFKTGPWSLSVNCVNSVSVYKVLSRSEIGPD